MKYTIDHIPKHTQHNRRPQIKLNAQTLTIHNTGNPKSTAQNERAWLVNPSNTRSASYHWAIDEHEIIECLPLDEVAWHAGDGTRATSGNKSSWGIEICESGNYAKTIENAIEFVASKLKEKGWSVDRLRRHFDWSGKICPRLMHDNGTWAAWHDFVKKVEAKLLENIIIEVKPTTIYEGTSEYKGFVYEGRTYAEVRKIAESAGKSVSWDGKNVHIK